MQRSVGHCVLTVSGLPGVEDSGRAGAALLTSTIVQASLSHSRRGGQLDGCSQAAAQRARKRVSPRRRRPGAGSGEWNAEIRNND